jgi:hypothetical protein
MPASPRHIVTSAPPDGVAMFYGATRSTLRTSARRVLVTVFEPARVSLQHDDGLIGLLASSESEPWFIATRL